MRVKCVNCGMIWDYREGPATGPHWVIPSVLDAMIAAQQTRCPKCGSNAYDMIVPQPATTSTTANY